MTERVALVVVAYNSAAHVDALVTQYATLSDGWSVLVVDNASADATVERAERAGLAVLRCPSNRGYGAACNLGAGACPADVYIFANPDVRTTTRDLAVLADAVVHCDAGRPPAFVGPVFGPRPWNAKRFSSIGRDIYGLGPRRLRPLLAYVSSGRWCDAVDIPGDRDPVDVDFPVGAVLACRADVFHALGGFDERFFLYSEEEDLCFRSRKRGWRSAVVPASHASHSESTSSGGHDSQSLAEVRLRSKLLYYRIHRGVGYAVIARLVLAALVGGHQLAARGRGRSGAYPAGLATALLRNASREHGAA